MINDIDKGLIKIPQFQREFVWSKEKSAKLIDSILKGYPIGTFIIWQTKDTLRSVKEVGELMLPQTPEGSIAQYVLDGQQRMTSIFACIKGVSLTRQDKLSNYADMWIDLSLEPDVDVVRHSIDEQDIAKFIRVKELYELPLSVALKFPPEYHSRLQSYRDRLKGFLFSSIVIRDVGIEIATEIFTRINTTGKDLTIFEIMVAKTYSEKQDFDLLIKQESLQRDLATVHYGTLPPLTALQVVAAILKKEVSTKSILSLEKETFISAWPAAVSAIESAIDYLRSQLRVPVSELLPFNATVVVIAYFFHLHPTPPTGNTQALLNDLFWRISLGGRYSKSADTKIAQDLRKVEKIVRSEQPDYDWPIENTYEYISDNGFFSASKSYIKALLCILAAQKPLSFDTNSEIHIRNDWLKRANSKNYHHFFPKSYLAGKQDYHYINHIANITIVDDRLNKTKIGAKKPSNYLKSFRSDNPKLEATLLKTHLISYEEDGLSIDDFNTFFDNRVKRFQNEIRKRLVPQKVDKRKQAPATDDLEEVALPFHIDEDEGLKTD